MFYFKGSRKPDFRNIQKIDYDRYWLDRGFSMRQKFHDRELTFIDWVEPDSKVVDIGCGNSGVLKYLKTQKNCNVLGIDTSKIAVEALRKEGVDAIVQDIESSSFEIEGQYDYMIFSEVLEHLRFPEAIIKKLSIHTKYFIISIPNSAFYRYRFGLMFGGRFFTQWALHPSEHLRYWSHIDFLDWLEAMNLKLIKWQSSNGFWFKDIWPNMFGHQICYLAKTNR